MTTQSVTEAELLRDYKYLPFTRQMITKLFPTLKHTRESSIDSKQFFMNGNSAMIENKLDRALEFISQSVNVAM